MDTKLREGINWVGYVDWNVRDFHGYQTDRGSTYNAYLVQDEKTAVIDAVKAPYAEDLLKHIAARTELDKVGYVVCNHAEPDHSGGIPRLMEACSKAELVCNEKCRAALTRHFDTNGWKFKIVTTGESLSLGRRTLQFIDTPMVHWPESMFTYCPEEKLLFSMDAFGQHYASSHRFDDEEPYETFMWEAKVYFANIVMLYGKPIGRALGKAAGLDIEMIAPSHGVIWRKHVADIVERYLGWVRHKRTRKALVIYDSMWQSTGLMAKAILEGVVETGAEAKLCHVHSSDNTHLVTEVLDAATIAFGSPTLNMTLMPEMASLLTYLKGLRPTGKAGFAFGSYGWSKGGAKDVEEYLKAMKFDLIRESLEAQFVPGADVLEECRQAGIALGEEALRRGED